MEIDNEWLRHFAKEFESRVANTDVVDNLLKEVGLARSDLAASNKRVDPVKEGHFFRAACDELKDLSFAAEAGSKFENPTHILGYITKCSETLREAIKNATRYAVLVDETLNHSLKMSGNYASMEVDYADGSFAKFHRRIEFAVFGAISRMRALTGVNFYPLEIRFQHPLRTASDRIRQLAGCPVHFGTERTEIILSHSCLELPILTFDPNLRKHLTEYGEKLLNERPNHNGGLRGKIEGVVLSGLPGRIVSAEEVASSLGLSRRSLARRLNEEGLSFREI
ncbi:MAG: AraC family transcriptional regulator ligand-binding domain-containing protein, partial [Roseibium sp.]